MLASNDFDSSENSGELLGMGENGQIVDEKVVPKD